MAITSFAKTLTVGCTTADISGNRWTTVTDAAINATETLLSGCDHILAVGSTLYSGNQQFCNWLIQTGAPNAELALSFIVKCLVLEAKSEFSFLTGNLMVARSSRV
jgi:hypothetical protein